MEPYAGGIDLEFMELDAEPRLTHWEAFILGLAQEVGPMKREAESNGYSEWA